MKVKRPSFVVSPCLMPRWFLIALTMTSEPQPPSWQGVWDYMEGLVVCFLTLFFSSLKILNSDAAPRFLNDCQNDGMALEEE